MNVGSGAAGPNDWSIVSSEYWRSLIQKLISIQTKKLFTVLIIMMAVLNSSMGSSVTSNAISYITDEFHISSEWLKVLPMSTFLIGRYIDVLQIYAKSA